MGNEETRYVKILNYGNNRLRERAEEVTELTDEDHQLIEDMMRVVKQFPALGLAAPQTGVNKRIIIVNTIAEIIPIINPVITEFSQEESLMAEGCLSIIGATADIERPNKVVVEGVDADLREVRYEWSGLLAHIVQHEIDHLNKILMTDYLKEYKRNKMLKAHRKFVRNNHIPVHSYKVALKKTA